MAEIPLETVVTGAADRRGPAHRRWHWIVANALRQAPAVSLLSDLDTFSTEHRRCGPLDGGVDDATVWLACECGAGPPAVLTTATPLT
jgi:hypothetical protein